LQVLYAIDGNPEVPETVLDHFEGYKGSRPVRVGNSARQLQLDIYGELMDSVYLFIKYGRPIGYDLWEALGRQLDWLERHSQLPDDEARDVLEAVREAIDIPNAATVGAHAPTTAPGMRK
jgi:GH15 family glucan-1,4-alpha-glucosidase